MGSMDTSSAGQTNSYLSLTKSLRRSTPWYIYVACLRGFRVEVRVSLCIAVRVLSVALRVLRVGLRVLCVALRVLRVLRVALRVLC
jgi:hypothetical protein